MSLESATFIQSLVSTNPVASDAVSQGDDHIRLLKSVLKATFPNATKAWYQPSFSSKSTNFTITSAEQGTTFLVSTASASLVATLPVLSSGDAGWECHFLKINGGTNPFWVQPGSGSINSGEMAGLTRARRSIPGHRTTAMWTGSSWWMTRVPNVPVGSIITIAGLSLPIGYEWPNGQTLSSASTNYNEYFNIMGSGFTHNLLGRVVAMKEVTETLITTAVSGFSGATHGGSGGSQSHTLTSAEMPSHTHTINIADSGHSHTVNSDVLNTGSAGSFDPVAGNLTVATATTSTNTSGITATAVATGGGGAHRNVQPTIMLQKILVVE